MLVLGIDEVGRGSLAGPLVVSAVALDRRISGLKDSKLLKSVERQKLATQIYRVAKFVGLGWVSVNELDSLGLSRSLTLGASRALEGLNVDFDRMVLDGSYNYIKEYPGCETVVKADTFIPAVSAASIVAKVARDNYMIELAKDFPLYKFEDHVGYGTPYHLEAIKLYGICAHHRRSFDPVRSMLIS